MPPHKKRVWRKKNDHTQQDEQINIVVVLIVVVPLFVKRVTNMLHISYQYLVFIVLYARAPR